MATTAYCTSQNIQDRLSLSGVNLRIDDAPTVITAVIKNASTKINFYCFGKYTADVLAANDWVAERCTDIATYILCKRRGNPCPESVKDDYNEAIQLLELIRAGVAQIPDAAQRKGQSPVLSQPRVKLYPVPESVIERNRSTGTPANYPQRNDPFEPPLTNY